MRHRTTCILFALAAASVGGCDTGEWVDDRGGVVHSDDGRVRLVIPPHALDEPAPIEIEVLDDRTIVLQPEGLMLRRPATLTVQVDEHLPFGTDDALLLTRRDDTWFTLPDQVDGTPLPQVHASVLVLTEVALVSETASDWTAL